ncbi:MAG: hypothetical protein IT445_00095 [Phycisphaeraceae bacterium]|nr:hypothetical protein [Phycisphaeraceae bacterium]
MNCRVATKAPSHRATKRRTAPARTVERSDWQGKPSAGRVDCPTCGKTFTAGSVITHPPMYDQAEQSHSVLRQHYCDHCNHVINWVESSDAGGNPTGVLITGPGVVRGNARVDRFLRRHPQAAGVVQV